MEVFKITNYKQKIFETLISLMLALICSATFAQKFMIVGEDTLQYKAKRVIQTDTVYFGDKTYYPGDTLYEDACNTFEKINGQIINRTDDKCLQQGLWIITDSSGNYSTGVYHNGNEIGLWKKYDKTGLLLKETESITIERKTYEVKEIDYSNGHAIAILDKPFLAFYLRNLYLISCIFFVSFFSRIFINSRVYNVENGTKYSPIYFFAPGYVSSNFSHCLLCTFTIWFSNYKPENRRFAVISNILSVVALVIFVVIFTGVVISR